MARDFWGKIHWDSWELKIICNFIPGYLKLKGLWKNATGTGILNLKC
jgi:hypothetical protein